MGVRSVQYLMVGVKLPYFHHNQFEGSDLRFEDDDAFEEFLDLYQGYDWKTHSVKHHNGLTIISDSMGGSYTVIGQVVERSEDEMMLYGMYDCKKTHEKYESLIDEVKALIQAQFHIENPEVGVLIFGHFS